MAKEILYWVLDLSKSKLQACFDILFKKKEDPQSRLVTMRTCAQLKELNEFSTVEHKNSK